MAVRMKKETQNQQVFEFETLEIRHMLSATADIVFLVDESTSQRSSHAGDAVRPWVSHIVGELEEKLVSRGVGVDQGHENRYGLIGLGFSGTGLNATESDVLRPLTTNPWAGNDDFWADASEFDIFLAQFQNEGDQEDGWAAVAEAVGADTIFDQEDGVYDFRSDAAVHLIIVSDESRAEAENETQIGGQTTGATSLFVELLEQLKSEEIETESTRNILNDAILTTVSDFDFDEDEILTLQDFGGDQDALDNSIIMGLDAHLLDGINVDDHTEQTSALAGSPTDFVAFTYTSTPSNVEQGARNGHRILDESGSNTGFKPTT